MEKQGFRLYDALMQEIDGIDHIKVVSSDFIEHDRWFWGNLPALIRRGEIVIEREKSEKRRLGGLITSYPPLVSLNDIATILTNNSDIGNPVKSDKNSLTYQNFLGFMAWSNLYGNGIRDWPVVDHVEVREDPVLNSEFYARFERPDRISPKSVYRPNTSII